MSPSEISTVALALARDCWSLRSVARRHHPETGDLSTASSRKGVVRLGLSIEARTQAVGEALGNDATWEAYCAVNPVILKIGSKAAPCCASAVLANGRETLAHLIFVQDQDAFDPDMLRASCRAWPAIAPTHLEAALGPACRLIALEPDFDLDEVRAGLYREQAAAQRYLDERLSDPHPPAYWAEKFQLSWRTIRRRIDAGQIRAERISRKGWRLANADLPTPDLNANGH